MNLKVDYTGDNKGFSLAMDLDCDIEKDAEALGYVTSCLFEAAKRLGELMENANPKYRLRMANGVAKSVEQMEKENNPHFPFTTFLQIDES